jgi:hypothetical protein
MSTTAGNQVTQSTKLHMTTSDAKMPSVRSGATGEMQMAAKDVAVVMDVISMALTELSITTIRRSVCDHTHAHANPCNSQSYASQSRKTKLNTTENSTVESSDIAWEFFQ